jgi:hypothetical protein
MGQVYEQRREFPRGAMLPKAVSTDVSLSATALCVDFRRFGWTGVMSVS